MPRKKQELTTERVSVRVYPSQKDAIKLAGVKANQDFIVSELIKRAKRDTGLDLETVGLSFEFMNYSLSFYGNEKEVVCDELVRNYKGKWQEIEVEPAYLQLMRERIDSEIELIEKESKEEFEDRGDLYNYNGVKRENFY